MKIINLVEILPPLYPTKKIKFLLNLIIVQCADYYYQKNEVDYLVTCTGRPISHISAIWKYNVTPNYTISFDIINSRAELGYGNRTHDAFVHTNYSFLINGNELSPRKASLFRKFVIESPKKSL
jgi:hypothetical protein